MSRPPARRVYRLVAALVAAAVALTGCAEGLPDDVSGYQERCLLMTPEPLPPTADDPHDGHKRVWACDVDAAVVAETPRSLDDPWPDGTLIVKDSVKEHQGYVWLVATARKTDGRWSWREYTRNFEGDDFLRILAPESVCVDCHRKAETSDWIYTAAGGD